jgi:putative ABC transport system ATP-binding protein
LQNISKIYGEADLQITALKNINLEINQGELLTIMGPSGSGKSTLLNILGTMDVPTEGKVLINGVDVARVKERKISKYRRQFIGFIFQDYYLLPNLNVIDNVLSPLIPYGISDQDRQRALDILDTVGLKGREKSTVKKLSGGQAQRVAIARALINNPQIILADEPTGNLDSETGKAIVDVLIKLSQSEKTVIIVTHDPRIGQTVGEQRNGRNIWLRDGKFSERPTYDVFCYEREE